MKVEPKDFVYEPVARSRSVERVLPAQAATDGAGVQLKRNLGPELHVRLDPFLLLDEFCSDDPQAYIAGFPDHPHRGFETVTYMLAGSMRHRDSAGNEGNLIAGSVQWMSAARGVIHSEMPQQESGLMRGFQLWVNLPRAHKMDDPAYQEFTPEQVPRYRTEDGCEVTVIAGRSHGVDGAARAPHTEAAYVDVQQPAATGFGHPIPPEHNAFIYVYEGTIEIESKRVGASNLVVLGDGASRDGVEGRTTDHGARWLLISGRPLRETIVAYGPFVMNSRREIEQAFEDYRTGQLTR